MRPLASLACLWALLACLGASRAGAQTTSPIEVRQVGWQANATLLSGTWNPIAIRLTGSAETEAAATVEVILKAVVGSTPPTAYPLQAYGQEIALPLGVTKDVKIWVPVPNEGTFLATIQLRGSNGQVLEESSVPTQTTRADVPLIATLADTSTLAAEVARIEVPYQQGLTAQVRSVELTPTGLPANAEYLSGFHGLIVEGTVGATLTGEQRRAIHGWIRQGGHLLVIGGPDGVRAAGVLERPDALPVRFGGLDTATDLGPLGAWVGPSSSPPTERGTSARIEASGGDRLAGSADRPLAVRTPLGEGTVTFLAADPALDPLRGWSGMPSLLKRALEPALGVPRANDPARRASNPQTSNDVRLVSALDALPPEVFPDWQHVALLLGGFTVVAGPILHVLLWRANRRPWLWVAVPVLSVVFTAAIYIMAGVQPGSDVVANVVTEVRLDPATGDAQQAVAVGFFAPLREQLTVRASGEAPVRIWLGSTAGLSQQVSYSQSAGSTTLSVSSSGSFQATVVDPPANPPYRVTTGRDTRIEFLTNFANQGGQRAVVLHRTLPAATGHLEADLHVEGRDGLIRGTVGNGTPYQLDQVALIVGQTLFKLGPLAPEQLTAVSVDPRTLPMNSYGNVAYSAAWQLFGVPSSQPRAATGAGVQLDLPDPDSRRRVRVMDAILARDDRGSQQVVTTAPSGPMLVALSSSFIGADTLPSASAQRAFELSILEQPIQVAIAPGPFALAPQLVPASVTVGTGTTVNTVGYSPGGQLWDLQGTVTYQFHAALPARARVDTLLVKTQQTAPATTLGTAPAAPRGSASAGQSVTPTTFSVYDWQAASWHPLQTGQLLTVVSPAAAYVSPEGLVSVQITSGGPNRTARFVAPELTIQGEAQT